MKNNLPLIAVIGVIATAIGILYFNNKTASQAVIVEQVLPSESEAEQVLLTDNVVAEVVSPTIETPVETTPQVKAEPTPTPTPKPVTPATETPVTNPVPTPAPVVAASTYVDGTYNVSLNYTVPESGKDGITVSLTLKDDVVTAVSTTHTATKKESEKYQGRFDGSYKALVIGKNLDSISLSRVGGASLTTKAFNQALQSIKTQA